MRLCYNLSHVVKVSGLIFQIKYSIKKNHIFYFKLPIKFI